MTLLILRQKRRKRVLLQTHNRNETRCLMFGPYDPIRISTMTTTLLNNRTENGFRGVDVNTIRSTILYSLRSHL